MKTINSLRSKLLTLTLALMASVSTFASDDHSRFLCCTILTDSTVAITGQSEYKTVPRYEYLPENLVIPAEVTLQGKTYKVVSIDQWAFYACTMLKSVVIPSTVTSIGMSAFHYCENLVDVYIPSSVTTVEGSAFSYTKWFDNLPDGEVYINNTLYRYKGTAPENTKIVVKDGTTRIAGLTFWNQSNIVSIELPQSLTVIEQCAFEGCTQLSSILIPKNVIFIGANAFADCTGLSTMTCIAPIPPTMGQFANPSANSEIFARVDVSNATLYVPAESVDAYKNADQWKDFGQILPIEQSPEDLFPTLWGLQRTVCNEYCGDTEDDNSANFTYKQTFDSIFFENDKPYILCNGYLLREEDNKIFLYSQSLNKDIVLYDFTLEVGDSLPAYIKDFDGTMYSDDSLVVTDISSVTLLDGKEYKKWTFDNGMEYVEDIGMYGGHRNGNFFGLIQEVVVPCHIGTHLVCVSKNGELLYQMDEAEMERLGAECLCDVEKKWTDTWCDTWNVLEHDRQYSGSGNYNEQTWRHYLAQDTIINGQTYTWVNCYWTLEESKVYRIALVRFTEDKKVYLLSGNQEQLVYDFSVEVGDTIETIVGAFYGNARQQLVVHQVDVDDATNRKTITLYPLCKLEEDFDCDQCDENGYYLSECCPVQWIEGVGSTDGFLMGDLPCSDWVGGVGCNLLCAYKNDELQYISKLYQGDYGCEYNAVEQNAADLFPTLWGLQRTGCTKTIGENENGTVWGSRSYLMQEIETATIDGKQYLLFGTNNIYDEYCSLWLREENNKILVYSTAQKKDLVLYDFTLNVGDSLSLLYVDFELSSVVDYYKYMEEYASTDPLVVTEVSTVTLLDGQEHKKWTFNNGMQYVEGIGSFGTCYAHNDFYQLIANAPLYSDVHSQHLVCVSKNNKLLYQMDEAEMERLGAECLCDYNRGPRKDNAKDGQIGGRPTPTQWNQLELDLREMENGTTILRAETFSYTLEDISQQVNNKTYFQLARQSTKDTATTKSVVGALHFGKDEDNRVYFLRDGVEYVLYDFTAEIGDTVEIFAGINNYPQETTYTHVVVDKDTTEDGACRMFLEVVFPDETNATAENAEKVWLAGLGSVDGIVHNAAKRTSNAHAAPSRSDSSETESSVMLCAWREDSCLYTTDHPDYNDIGCIYNQDPTAIEDTHSPSPIADYQKLLRDGQLLIIHKGKTYNVLGVQVK